MGPHRLRDRFCHFAGDRAASRGLCSVCKSALLSQAQILAGKGLACFLACTSVAVVLLGIATTILGVRIQDPVQLTMGVVSIAICFVGMMMLVSTLGKTGVGRWPEPAGAFSCRWPCWAARMVPLFVMPKWMLTVGRHQPRQVGHPGGWRGPSGEATPCPT